MIFLCIQDDGTQSHAGSTDTLKLFDGEVNDSQEKTTSATPCTPPVDISKLTKKSAAVVLRFVLGKLPEREGLVKMLRGKFEVPHRSLTALTPSQLMETLARKFISMKYVVINSNADYGNLARTDLKVLKEIDC